MVDHPAASASSTKARKRASQTGEKLLIESHVAKFGRSSFTIVHIFRDASGEVRGTPTLFIDGGQMAAKFGTWTEASADFREGRWRLR